MTLGEFLGHFDVRPIADSISSNRSSNATGGPAKLPVAVSQEDSAIFHRRSACRESHGANAETCPAHARASGLEARGPALRTVVPRSLYCVTGDAIARGPGAATRERSFRVARANAGGSLRGQSRKSLCKCKKLVGAFRKSVQWSIQKLRSHPEPSQPKQRREEKGKT